MPVLDHTHIYVRYKVTDNGIVFFKCNHPACNHFAEARLIEGKATICSICQERSFILTSADLRLKRPRCIFCSKSKLARRAVRDLEAAIPGQKPIEEIVKLLEGAKGAKKDAETSKFRS